MELLPRTVVGISFSILEDATAFPIQFSQPRTSINTHNFSVVCLYGENMTYGLCHCLNKKKNLSGWCHVFQSRVYWFNLIPLWNGPKIDRGSLPNELYIG